VSRHIPRIYCPECNSEGFWVPEYQRNHMVHVLRMREGTQILAFNETHGEWLCEIESIRKSSIDIRMISQTRAFMNSPKLALGICQIKPENMKLVIEKCTELGVTDFYLLKSEYTNYTNNINKLRRIAIFASEQSERMDIPNINEEKHLHEFVNNLPAEYAWFSAIERIGDAQYLLDFNLDANPLGFIVGAEGGFSDAEKLLLNQKTTAICLSQNILRSETAAIACIAFAGMMKK